MRSKIIEDHEPGCTALAAVERGDWSTPWFLPRSPTVYYRDGLFRKHQDLIEWVELGCNSTTCNGRAVVRERDISELGPGSVQSKQCSK